MGRPSDFSQEIADRICERLADGLSLRAICRDEDYPCKSSVFKWLSIHPDFADQYARAREAQADSHADDIVEIADDGAGDWILDENGNPRINQDHIARSRLRVDARKWIASKLKPKRYGDKTETTLVGDKERPIVMVPVDAEL